MSTLDESVLQEYAAAAVDIARRAGERILEVYERGFDVDTKTDGSPVTTADRSAHGRPSGVGRSPDSSSATNSAIVLEASSGL